MGPSLLLAALLSSPETLLLDLRNAKIQQVALLFGEPVAIEPSAADVRITLVEKAPLPVTVARQKILAVLQRQYIRLVEEGEKKTFMRDVRTLPALRDDAFIGFKLFGIRPKSIHAQKGLQNGDTITKLDGVPLTRESAETLADRTYSSQPIKLEVERRGATQTITWP